MFLAIVLYGMSNNFHMTVKELYLYAWALHYKGICFEGVLGPASRFIRFVSKEESTQCHGWTPLVGVDVEVKREIDALPGIETYSHSQYTVSVLFVSHSLLYTFGYSEEIWSIQIWNLFNILKPQKNGNACLFIAFRFPKEHCYFFKVFRLWPFVLITAACKWIWAWSTGGTILKGENPST